MNIKTPRTKTTSCPRCFCDAIGACLQLLAAVTQQSPRYNQTVDLARTFVQIVDFTVAHPLFDQ